VNVPPRSGTLIVPGSQLHSSLSAQPRATRASIEYSPAFGRPPHSGPPEPLLLLAQTQAGRLARRFGPATLLWIQRAAILLAALLLVWRGITGMQGGCCCH